MIQNTVTIHRSEKNMFVISGTLDFDNVVYLYNKAKEIIDGSEKSITFDLSKTQYKSSAGLALLLCLLRYAKQKKVEIHTINLPKKLSSVAKISNVEQLISA